MKPDVFDKPVTILTGLGVPTPVRSVMQAYRMLCDWPAASRDRAHTVALNGCHAALTGNIEAETARGLFVAFAKRQDMLAPDLDTLMAIQGRSRNNPHIQ